MAATYPPAQTPWSIGDLVIHDDDAKRADVLMVVTGCGSDGIHRTRCAFPTEQPRSGQREVWRHNLAPAARSEPLRHRRAARSIHAGSVSFSTTPISSNAAAIRPQRHVVKR
jgi:hypothetical protein